MSLLFLLPGAFLAPIIHEFVKARVSAALGDPTPKKNGFLTWNPLKFFEPIGFFLMMAFQVGWGQPVPTSPFYYKNKKMGTVLTYAAPMVVNLLVGMTAIAVVSLTRANTLQWAVENYLAGGGDFSIRMVRNFNSIMSNFGRLNIRLAVFNLIPVFPMAMNKILSVFVAPETSMRLNHYEKPLQILLFMLLIFGVLEAFMHPITNIFVRAVRF